MLKRLLKRLALTLSFTALLVLALYGSYLSTHQSLRFPTEGEINHYTNVSGELREKDRQALIKSRQSAVQVASMEPQTGIMSASSGIYFAHQSKHYVLTTFHGILGDCLTTKIIVEEEAVSCINFTLIDIDTDYIIIETEEIETKTPLQIPTDIPKNREWTKKLAVMNQVYYTGFPNNEGPLTFGGKIIGFDSDEAIFIDSFAWAGSSGSGVFSSDGKLIGYVLALDVGETRFGIEVLENFVWVIPLFRVRWEVMLAP